MSAKQRSFFKQILIILTVICLFLTAACINKSHFLAEYRALYIGTGIVDLLAVMAWIWLGSGQIAELERENIRQSLYDRAGLMVTLLYCFLCRILQFGDTPQWDGITYYQALVKACQNFDFSFSQYWQEFSLVGHPTIGYASLVAIGEFLAPNRYIGFLWINMILALLAAFCVYRVMEKVLPDKSVCFYTISACFVMSMPMVLGTFSYFSPDIGIVYFLAYIIYGYVYRRNVLMFFAMLLLVQTKEVGVVVLAGFVAGLFVKRVFGGKKGTVGGRFLAFLKEPLGFGSVLAAIMMLLYVLVRIKRGLGLWSYGSHVSSYMSTFTVIPEFILYKWKQFFSINFAWAVWLGNFILFYLVLIRRILKKKKIKVVRREVIAGIFGTAAAILAFYCLYITFALPRYQIVFEFCGGFLFVLLMGMAVSRRAVCSVVTGSLGVCMLIQSFVTIDPLMLGVFQNRTTGNGKIVMENPMHSELQRDYCIYNHQFNYLNKAYNAVLRTVGYYEEMDILVWNKDTTSNFWNEGFYWDMEEQRLTLEKNENTISMRGFAREDFENYGAQLELNKEAVMLVVPQFGLTEEYAEKFLEKYYDIRYRGEVEIPLGGKVTFYVCDLVGERMMQE